MSAPLWQKLGMRVGLRAVGILKHMTLGARCLVVMDGRLLLVRHVYYRGLHLPGGGVDPGETAEAAAARELREETGHEPVGPLRLLGLYHNTEHTDRDHVALFLAEGARAIAGARPSREIAEAGWFSLDPLPAEATAATGRRVEEYLGRTRRGEKW